MDRSPSSSSLSNPSPQRIDEQYLPHASHSRRDPRSRSPQGITNSDREPMIVQDQSYDPGERIPSYESSQEQHQRRFPHSMQRLHDLSAIQSSGYVSDPSTAPVGTATPGTPVHSGAALAVSGVLAHVDMPPVLTTTNMRSRPGVVDSAASRSLHRDAVQTPVADEKHSLKTLGLRFLTARQHFLLAACRDASLIPCVIGLCRSWWFFFHGTKGGGLPPTGITSARVSEHFLTGLWCLVAGYLSYSVLDGLMVRWIVSYTTTGSIVRMATMSAILVALEEYLVAALSAEGYNYGLHSWILISCALTFLYIVQNFITSNIDLRGKRRPRFFDVYNIVVFAVVPVGMASFITMIGLLRSLIILRLDIDQQSKA